MASNAKPLSSLTSTDRERFWSRVEVLSTDQCWLWKAAMSCGYGAFNVGKYALYRSHRLAYYFTYGEDPGKLLVCHKCDNPPCCNPYHLFLGTHQDNVADRVLKGRSSSGQEHWTHGKHPESISRGSARPLAKLTESKVVTIREQLYGGVPVKTLAAEFGVSQSVIYAIRKREIWKHVT